MGLSITNQINQNECGLCVLHTLIQYHHKKDIPMTELSETANLKPQGLSVYDLEVLAQKYGLFLDSYNASIDDLKTVKPNQPFILILKSEVGLHYVIGVRSKKGLFDIYCSQKGHYQVNRTQLENLWVGIYIECSKQAFNFKNASLDKPLSFQDLKGAIIINGINFIYLIISLFCSTLMQKITEQITSNIYLNTIIAILVTYLVAYLCQYLLQLFISLINHKRNYQAYCWIYQLVVKQLAHKYQGFFDKVDYNYLISLDDYLFIVSSFYTTKLSDIFTNVVLILAVVFISAIMNVWVLLILIICIILNVILSSITYWYQKNNLHEIKKEVNHYQQHHIKFIDLCKSFSHQEQLQAHQKTLNQHHKTIKNRYFRTHKFMSEWGFWDGFSNIAISIILILIAVWLIQMDKLNLSQLIFLVSLFQLVSQHIKNLCSVPGEIVQVKHAKTVINNIIKIDNLIGAAQNINEEITKVTINDLAFNNDTLLSGPNGVGKTYLLKCLCQRIKNDYEIKINETTKTLLGNLWFLDHCIYLDQHSICDINAIEALLGHSKYANTVVQVLAQAHIEHLEFERLSSGQKQVLNLVSLMAFKHKIIILDEALSNVDNEMKKMLLTNIKPMLVKDNFVISVDHQSPQFYQHQEVLHEPLY